MIAAAGFVVGMLLMWLFEGHRMGDSPGSPYHTAPRYPAASAVVSFTDGTATVVENDRIEGHEADLIEVLRHDCRAATGLQDGPFSVPPAIPALSLARYAVPGCPLSLANQAVMQRLATLAITPPADHGAPWQVTVAISGLP